MTAQDLHSTYCSESGTEPTYAVWERAYFDFLKIYTCDDLKLVCRFVRAKNKKMNGAAYSIAPKKIFDFEYLHFDSLLSEAKAWQRNRIKPPTPKEQILQSFRPEMEQIGNGNVRTIGDVFKTIKTN